ncbi:MAG: Nif3-like dinuclear metal center hexameric protein [Bacteroidetes bacterium]|nr:Nif3-like dinuclear metal center hexameric protein [Bacteroidota bacterium]
MTVQEIISAIESFAPLVYQESYDNSGLQVGERTMKVNGVLLSLDITEDVLDEAIQRGCNLIIAHHPIIFSGLKQITGKNYVERIVSRAIKADLAIYAAHTNLDNVNGGVNAMFAERIGLQQTCILTPQTNNLKKLYTYVPNQAVDTVRNALFAAGAGSIGRYHECSFNTDGLGTFRPNNNAKPTIGTAGGERETVSEVKIEVLINIHQEPAILKALFANHPYEEVAYEIISLQNRNQEIGSGMIGNLKHPISEIDFLSFVKQQMKTDCIRHTSLIGKPIQRVAICGGSGSFLLKDAIRAGADIFITGDFKYHQFFDADKQIIIADIGHYESEQFTVELLARILKEKIPNFAPLLSNLSTNPVKYFC